MVATKEAAVSPNPLPANDQENITASKMTTQRRRISQGKRPLWPGEREQTRTEDTGGSIHTSSSVSLSESITKYRRIHGRTYT
ncbi:hypothetical protein CDEST_00956 [Colletotrichum destructivum]|uniref:Uncharacterized protein n=1 Tax=Colletotrichum destructivum TaxID=34406 RepID=A0AAX4HXM8_9PEZI|nr:hypothetical protein CDEST_00956 [Colletotrichum destructivum]